MTSTPEKVGSTTESRGESEETARQLSRIVNSPKEKAW
jgi:hypothetical protein